MVDTRGEREARAEFVDVYEIESDFEAKVKQKFEEMVAREISPMAHSDATL